MNDADQDAKVSIEEHGLTFRSQLMPPSNV